MKLIISNKERSKIPFNRFRASAARNLLVFLLSISSCIYPFSYDSAIYKAQKGNWQDAHVALNNIVTDNPDKADVMYDAGVAAYNLGNTCQAATCFTRAAECGGDKNICFRAHFNAGNTHVDEKKLQDALAEYDKALAIEPDNEYARHNRDRVAEMLKQQDAKEEKQNKDDKQENDQQNDEEKKDKQQNQNQEEQNQEQNSNQQSSDGNDKQQNNSKKNQQGNDNQNQESNSQKSDSSNDESLNEQAQGDQGSDGKDSHEQKTGAAKQRAEQHKNSGDDKKRDGKDELEKKSKSAQNERNKQQREKHGTSPQQANVSEQKTDDKNNVPGFDGQEQFIDDPWLLNVLQNQELHDKAVNKQLMEAKIRQHGGKNGQNCW